MTLPPSPSLGSKFPPAMRDDWRRAVDQVLGKGADLTAEQLEQRYRRQLVTTLDDGIEVQPLYTAADVDPAVLAATGLPGFPPYVRGSVAGRAAESGWEVRQQVDLAAGDPARTATTVVAELECGATGVLLGIGSSDRVDVDLLDAALAGVYLELVPVSLTGVNVAVDAAAALLELWERRDVPAADARGSLGCDPIGHVVRAGGSADGIAAGWDDVAVLALRCATERPQVRAVVVDGTTYHEAGAGDAQELGSLLAAGVAALRALTERGLHLDQAMSQVELRVAATADQFATIAKLRALRSLWDRIGEVAGAARETRAARVHAVTSSVMLTRYDPWVNLLRNTVACFAAGIGGADAVTVVPHDAAATPGEPSSLARRMARNTQTVLTDESNLARVIDAAGGSWYVESLTEAMADAAWAWFQELEAAGGLVASLQAGLVHERLAATWTARTRRLATRAEPITGISEFPLVDEIVSPVPPTALPVTATAGRATTEIAALPKVRRSEGFEALRAAADDHTRRHGTRPTVVLVGLGTPADHNARSGFAKNLFEAGGVATVLVEGVAPEDLAATVAQRDATVACLCSSDARYPDLVPGAAAALQAGGVTEIYLAGKPGDHETAWAEAGVDRYVFAGCDALDVLGHLHERLGIQPVTQAGEETS